MELHDDDDGGGDDDDDEEKADETGNVISEKVVPLISCPASSRDLTGRQGCWVSSLWSRIASCITAKVICTEVGVCSQFCGSTRVTPTEAWVAAPAEAKPSGGEGDADGVVVADDDDNNNEAGGVVDGVDVVESFVGVDVDGAGGVDEAVVDDDVVVVIDVVVIDVVVDGVDDDDFAVDVDDAEADDDVVVDVDVEAGGVVENVDDGGGDGGASDDDARAS